MVSLFVIAYFFLVLNFLIFSYLNALSYLSRKVIIPLILSLVVILLFNIFGFFNHVISDNSFNSLLLKSGAIIVAYITTSIMTMNLRDKEKTKRTKGLDYVLRIWDFMRLHFVCIAISFIQIMIIYT